MTAVTGIEQTSLHDAAYAVGERPQIDVALDGRLVFTVGNEAGARVFATVAETLAAYKDLAELRRPTC